MAGWFKLISLAVLAIAGSNAIWYMYSSDIMHYYSNNFITTNPCINTTHYSKAVNDMALDIIDNYAEQLNPDAVPNQVLYYWCGEARMFEYQHYLSMKSVIRVLRPDNIYFILDNYPVLDDLKYNSWLTELRDEFPFIRMEQTRGKGCSVTGKERIDIIKEELSARGGFYVHENTMVTPKITKLRTNKLVDAMDDVIGQGVLMAQMGEQFTSSSQQISCIDSHATVSLSSIYCMHTVNNIYPKDIWNANSTFGLLARWVAYGRTALPRAVPDYAKLVPNIAHYVCWQYRMDYTFYLSILSVLHVVNVDVVYIHGGAPTGPYWDKVKGNNRIKVIYRNASTFTYGQSVKVLAHISDVWRLDILLKYGGLYLDTDAIFVKPLDEHIRAYDVVFTITWGGSRPKNDKYPMAIQNGVMLSKPWAPFWLEYQKTYRVFRDDWWLWNSCLKPYKVLEHYPDYVHTDTGFQVGCYNGKCRPMWWPNSSDMNIHHLSTDSLSDWKNSAYVYHFTGEAPIELTQEGASKRMNTILADMVQFVLNKAGLDS